jgi:hypothetical protein
MPSIYDDPELQPEPNEFPDSVEFHQRGDRVRARINRMEPLKTRYGTCAKYWLFDLDRNMERTMLAGAKNLWGQLLTLKPEVGDTVDIELVDFAKNENGTAKLFEVSVERSGEGPAPVREPQRPSPSPQPVAASRTAPAYADEDEDLFER